jgi:hypothetical protein
MALADHAGYSTPNFQAVAGPSTDPNERVMARLAKDFPDRMCFFNLHLDEA